MQGDQTGRSPDGKEIDLYPFGWDRNINEAQAELIKVLIPKAIEQGVIERWPNRKIEHEFGRMFEDQGFLLKGFIDVLLPDQVIDHKTTSNMRYAKSPQGLIENIQMNCYAGELIMHRNDRGGSEVDNLTLRHNVFLKDVKAPRIKIVKADVSAEDIEQFWKTAILPLTEIMVELSGDCPDWNEVPAPTTTDPCNKYGGCPFLEVCWRGESIESYKNRVDRVNSRDKIKPKGDQETTTKDSDKEEVMGIFDKSKLKKKGRIPSTQEEEETLEINPPKGEENEPQETTEEATEVEEIESPPWANPKCKACGGKGFNTRGKVCDICRFWGSKNEMPSPDDFIITKTNGVFSWVSKNEAVSEGEVTVIPEPKVKEVEAEPEPEPEVIEAEPEEVVEEPEADTEGIEAGEKKKTRKRKRKSFTLLVNCVLVRGAQKRIDLDTVLMQYGTQLAQEWGKESFYECDPFKRRDAMAMVAAKIVEDLGTTHVQVFTDSPDGRALLDALRPYAHCIIQGV